MVGAPASANAACADVTGGPKCCRKYRVLMAREVKPVTTLATTNPFEREAEATNPEWIGGQALYRLVYVGSPVLALIESPRPVGKSALLWQTDRPMRLRRTDVVALPGMREPVLREVRQMTWTRPGTVLTVIEVPFDVPDRGFHSAWDEATRQAETALTTAITLLDERIAYRRAGDITEVALPDGTTLSMDVTRAVWPYSVTVEDEHDTPAILDAAADLDLDADATVSAALRCYLAAVERAKTPNGFILLCSALEELVIPPRGKKSFNSKALQEGLTKLGIITDEKTLSEIARARAQVHKALQDDKYLYDRWNDLHTLVRTALRARLGVTLAWPPEVQATSSVSFTYAVGDADDEPGDTDPPSKPVVEEVADLRELASAAARPRRRGVLSIALWGRDLR